MNTEQIKKLKAEAKKIAKANGLKKIWANVSGEFFTSENLALLSVNGKKDDVTDFEFSDADIAAEEKGNDKKPVIISKADIDKYPELAVNGWAKGDQLEEGQDIDWAIKNKKA